LHLIHFHGVLAPNAKLRALVVPARLDNNAGLSASVSGQPVCAHHGPARMCWARLFKREFEVGLEHCLFGAGLDLAVLPRRS
jgi:hypothetical protein